MNFLSSISSYATSAVQYKDMITLFLEIRKIYLEEVPEKVEMNSRAVIMNILLKNFIDHVHNPDVPYKLEELIRLLEKNEFIHPKRGEINDHNLFTNFVDILKYTKEHKKEIEQKEEKEEKEEEEKKEKEENVEDGSKLTRDQLKKIILKKQKQKKIKRSIDKAHGLKCDTF